MRLFVAIRLDASCKDVLCTAIAGLKGHASHGNFSRRDNLHLTLAFIGETNLLDAANQALGSIRAEPFTMEPPALGDSSEAAAISGGWALRKTMR